MHIKKLVENLNHNVLHTDLPKTWNGFQKYIEFAPRNIVEVSKSGKKKKFS